MLFAHARYSLQPAKDLLIYFFYALLISALDFSGIRGATKTSVSISPEQARHRLAELKKDFTASDFVTSSENGDTYAVGLFLQSGMSVDARGKEGETALMRAAGEGQMDTMGLLFTNKANLNAKSTDDRTALIVAAAGGHVGAVKFLCEHGAQIDAKSRKGVTALYAATFEGHMETVSYLLSKGADVAQPDFLGNTPPLIAVQRKHYWLIELFLKDTRILNATNVAGFAAADYLRAAASSDDAGAERALKKLQSAGVSLLTQHYFLETQNRLAKAIRVSAGNYAREISQGKEPVEPFTGLVTKYVAEFETNSFPAGNLAVLYLAAAEALGEARFSFQSGLSSFGPSDAENAAKDALNDAQRTLLRKYEATIGMALQDPKFDPNMTDEKGRAPLHIIASTGNIAVAKALIDKGANPNLADARGNTPIKTSERVGKPEMIDLLRASGR